jgi:hypothetical protein
MERWQAVERALDEFQSYLAPSVPRLSIAYACDKRWPDEEYKRRRPKGFPSRLRGIYLIYDEAETLLYVGVAMWNYDKRCWSHDTELPRRHLDIIPLDDEHAFLALSLEFFLISKLRPRHNSSYRDYSAGKPAGVAGDA